MEQLQQVFEFLKTWRFWICVGLSAILASLISYFGTPNVAAQVENKKNSLNAAYEMVNRFGMGQHPNPSWGDEIKKLEQVASGKVTEIQDKIYGEQSTLMVWPEQVAAEFNKRPFNAALDDQQGRLLFFYYKAMDDQYEQMRKLVDPIEVTSEGKVIGKVVFQERALDRPKWTSPPPSRDAWVAQEQVWIQRSVLQAIAKINEPYKSWYDAPVREIIRIAVGAEGVDIKRVAELSGRDAGGVKLQELPLPGAVPAAPGTGSASAAGDDGLNLTRYLQLTADFREIPVFIQILGDQRKLPEILAALAGIDFGFVINETSWTVPSTKVEVPSEIQEYSDTTPGSARDVIDNTIEISVWGDMRIYEMPAGLKQKYEQERQAAQQLPPAPM